ncbi:hypothetical protein [Bacillus sp. AFS055030]|uniref:hypothetical protein n=1 Tax=Bacillus sp. AFS055030 TaxID=2033507 RepID=UPI000BFD509B|nr:hypothetical protein [Bacillus sp. AFS055030]PGL70126.1 hypothetical protein CN925_13120 [Bacillus sp. AFS055030]
MKRILIVTLILLFTIPNAVFSESITSIANPKCPQTENLVKPNSKDKKELISALSKIIPKVYGTDPNYNEWQIEKIEPASSLTGFEKNYYGIAVTFCGKKVANYSWFVRLRFPKLLPAQSASLGEIYIVKELKKGWIPWFQYH